MVESVVSNASVKPTLFSCLKQRMCAFDIGLEEGVWAVNGPIHMGFSGEVNDSVD